MTFPWAKFQDFYLRVGFLKALVAVLDPGRRSVANEAILRRLEPLLFEPARRDAEVWKRLGDRCPWLVSRVEESEKTKSPSLAEAMMILGDRPSLDFGITPKTAYKTLDWGRNIGFLGRGNQITESAQVLRALLTADDVDAFLRGDVLAWNPFEITASERFLFLEVLARNDQLTLAIAASLADRAHDDVIESRDAGILTCQQFFRLLDSYEDEVPASELVRFRAARELACNMAVEMRIDELVARCGGSTTPRLPTPRGFPGTSRAKPGAAKRRTTKNTDHQTIPRFEQLVDLGFLGKPGGRIEEEITEQSVRDRKRWMYVPTPACAQLARSGWAEGVADSDWAESQLAQVALAVSGVERPVAVTDPKEIGRRAWNAYDEIKRPVGHTPAYSVALLAAINAASDGLRLEMSQVHRLLLEVKERDLCPDHAYFASGNDLDKMFVLLRPGFEDRVAEAQSKEIPEP